MKRINVRRIEPIIIISALFFSLIYVDVPILIKCRWNEQVKHERTSIWDLYGATIISYLQRYDELHCRGKNENATNSFCIPLKIMSPQISRRRSMQDFASNERNRKRHHKENTVSASDEILKYFSVFKS